MKLRFFSYRKLGICLFFTIFLFLGLSIYRDYGISWDEYPQYIVGKSSFQYVTKGDPTIFLIKDRFYGPALEILFIFSEKLFLRNADTRDIFFLRHFLTFIVFYISTYFFYQLCQYKFKDYRIALLGTLFLILSPRIFAHSFYNSKDIPTLSLFIISIYSLIIFLEDKKPIPLLLHTLICAFLIAIRPIGLLVVFLTIILFVKKIYRENLLPKKFLFKQLIPLGTFIVILFPLIILFWPLLWQHPIVNFINALQYFVHFSEPHPVFYLGQNFKSTLLPWHYLPVWILISTPLIYILLFFIGSFSWIKGIFRNKNQSKDDQKWDIILFVWFFLPVLYVIFREQNLYGGWRHLFFIYPAFLIIALNGFQTLTRFPKMYLRGFLARISYCSILLILGWNLTLTVLWMIKYHPYQNIYFNKLSGKDMVGIKAKFDLDYWGLSYREGLEYLLNYDPKEKIKIYVANTPGLENAFILKPEQKKRLIYMKKPDTAEYILTNERNPQQKYSWGKKIHSIMVENVEILSIFSTKS